MNNRFLRIFNFCCNISDIVERLLKFLNTNTYIMVAIHGNPFCQSMRDSFNLLMRNLASVYVTNRVTRLQFTVLTIAIAAGMGGLTYWFLPKKDTELMIFAILMSVIGSALVAETIFGVYSMAIDTLFLCFCKYLSHKSRLQGSQAITVWLEFLVVAFDFISVEDCERNDGSVQRPYYMAPELMRVLHKNHENLLPPPYEQA